MRFDRNVFTWIVLGSSAFAWVNLSGCEDSNARQRANVQAQIQQASMKLQKALAGGAANESSSQSLNAVVADLSHIQGGEPGQQAAKSLLSATAQLELANVKLDAAQSIEADHQSQCSVLLERVGAIQQLTSDADALESMKAVEVRQNLQQALAAAQDQAKQLSAKIDELNGPITESAKANEDAKKQVQDLKLKVNDLQRKAQELGSADGFDTYKQAIQTRRDADKIEYDISQREIELEYSLTPDLSAADTQSQQVEALIKSIDSAKQQIDAMASATAEQVAANRKQASDLAGLVSAAIAEMDKQRNEQLEPAYTEALTLLEKANAEAQSAARQSKGDDAQAARLVAVQTQQMIARANLARARGLQDEAEVLNRFAATSFGKQSDAQLKTMETAVADATEKAKAALQSAKDLAAQVQLRNDPTRMESIVKNLDAVSTALDHKPAAPTTTATAGASAGASPVPTHFESADALVEFLAHTPANGADLRALASVSHATTPQATELQKASNAMVESIAMIDDAARAKLGTGILEGMQPMLASMSPKLKNAKVLEQDENHVVYEVSVMGQTTHTTLSKIDGAWVIDLDKADEKQMAAAAMMAPMAQNMAKSAQALVKRIEAGEFKSTQEIMAAFNQALMTGMGGAGAGAPSGPPR